MTSQIDPTVPVFGTPTTSSVRNNFLIARNEIEALQALIGSGGGNGFGPPLNVSVGGNVVLPSSSNFFIFVSNLTGTSITLTLPTGAVVGQQVIIKDVLGNASAYNITVNSGAVSSGPVTGIDNNANYPLMSDFGSLSVVWTGTFWGTF